MKVLVWSQRYSELGDYREVGNFETEDILDIVDIAMFMDIEDDEGNLLTPTNIYYSFRENALVIETE